MIKKFIISLFILTSFSAVASDAPNICGQWDLQSEGIYDGFILNKNNTATILSIEKLNSSYYVQGNMIHIPHNRGGEFLLEMKNNKSNAILLGQDFWTKGSVYQKNPDKPCQ
ncbi:MAG: hypothetical protein ACK5LE_10065 [Alphaproteobacteria bacterium]